MEKYNQYLKCPNCGTVFNLIRSKRHLNSKKCVYVQSIKEKTELSLKDKLFLQILEQKNKIKYDNNDSSILE